jgi:3-deoxy-manno-octulosonate cytidylyltransferase (CMP-KDO synthetase)
LSGPVDLLVIPARFGSTRLPGKPLIRIAGKTLLERVINVAQRAAHLAGNVDVVVATDDERIQAHARDTGCEAILTAPDISSGSGRACVAAQMRTARPTHVVNLQGDTPFTAPCVVADMIGWLRRSSADVVTPVVQLDWMALDQMRAHKRTAPYSGTTCIRTADGRALWFSKAIIPAVRDEAVLRAAGPLSPVFRHLGLYAYRLAALEWYERAPASRYEQLEGLEQLRWLEMGADVRAVEVAATTHSMSGIDTMEDVALAETLISRFGDPMTT